MSDSLKDLLSQLNVPVLRSFCESLGLHKGISRKMEFVNRLVDEIANNLAGILKELSLDERSLLAEIAYHAEPYEPAEFQAKYPGRLLTRPPASWSRYADFVWMFCTMENDRYVMDPGLAARIKAILPKPPDPILATMDDVPAAIPDKNFGSRPVTIHKSNLISLIELKRVLRLVKAGKVEIAAHSQQPTGESELTILTVLLSPDNDLELPQDVRGKLRQVQSSGTVRSTAWPVLLQLCGWSELQARKLVLTPRGKKFLLNGDLEEFRKGVRRFIEKDYFDELSRIDNITGQTGSAKRYLTPPSQRRRTIYQHMKSWPEGKWIAFSEAYRFLRASGSGFQTSTRPTSLYFGPKENGDAIASGGFLNRLYFRAFLFESLGVLGLIDLAFTYPHFLWPEFEKEPNRPGISFSSRYDGLLFVRLNKLGAYCLGLVDKYDGGLTEYAGLLRVLPNHEIVVLNHGDLPRIVRYILTCIAKPTTGSVWILDKGRFLEYLEEGGDLKELLGFLAAFSSDGIPANVTQYLGDLAEKGLAVVGFEDTLLIEFEDENTVAEILRDRKTSQHCKLAHERFVVISKEAESRFRTAIKKLGYVLPQ
jgi:hypothetical protein